MSKVGRSSLHVDLLARIYRESQSPHTTEPQVILKAERARCLHDTLDCFPYAPCAPRPRAPHHFKLQNQHNTCHHDDDEGYRRCGGACAIAAFRSSLGIGRKATIVGKYRQLFYCALSFFHCDRAICFILLNVTACMQLTGTLHPFNFL